VEVLDLVLARLATWPKLLVHVKQIDANLIMPKDFATILNPHIKSLTFDCPDRLSDYTGVDTAIKPDFYTGVETAIKPDFHAALVRFLPTSSLSMLGATDPTPALLEAVSRSPSITTFAVCTSSVWATETIECFFNSLVHVKAVVINFCESYPTWVERLPVDTLTRLHLSDVDIGGPLFQPPGAATLRALQLMERIVVEQGTVTTLQFSGMDFIDSEYAQMAALICHPLSPIKTLEAGDLPFQNSPRKLEDVVSLYELFGTQNALIVAFANPACRLTSLLSDVIGTKYLIERARQMREMRIVLIRIGMATDTRKAIPDELLRSWEKCFTEHSLDW
jgi:hypothetical protein